MPHRRNASIFGTVPPTSVTPEFPGQIYYDETSLKFYASRSTSVGDWVLLGDMQVDTYDSDNDNLVDSAEQLNDGVNIVTASEIRNFLDNLPVFGTELQTVENLSVTTSTSTGFTNKIDFDTTNLPSGLYKVEWSYGWNYDNFFDDFEAELALNDQFGINNLIMKHKQEPKDTSGSGSGRFSATATDQLFRSAGFRILNLSGVNNFKLRFRTLNPGTEASIWDVTLVIYRIS
jgi:hypothetical protein